MERRRTSVEVIADILRLGQAGKTEIMYSANMSYFPAPEIPETT